LARDNKNKTSTPTNNWVPFYVFNSHKSSKAKDLQVTLNLLFSVKGDGMEEQTQQLESKLAAMKERITQLKDLNSVNHGESSTAKINAHCMSASWSPK